MSRPKRGRTNPVRGQFEGPGQARAKNVTNYPVPASSAALESGVQRARAYSDVVIHVKPVSDLAVLTPKIKCHNPPRPLASKRVDLISNKLIKMKKTTSPISPPGPPGGHLLEDLSVSPASQIAAGCWAKILRFRVKRPKVEPSIFRDRSLTW